MSFEIFYPCLKTPLVDTKILSIFRWLHVNEFYNNKKLLTAIFNLLSSFLYISLFPTASMN